MAVAELAGLHITAINHDDHTRPPYRHKKKKVVVWVRVWVCVRLGLRMALCMVWVCV